MSGEQNRAHVLARIRSALGVTEADATRRQAVRDRLSRHPRGPIPARAGGDREILLQRFVSLLQGQGAETMRVSSAEEAVRAIAGTLSQNGLPPELRLGADPSLAALPWQAAPDLLLRHGKAEPTDKAGLSRAIAGAAESGTLFLVSGADNPTTLAFLPEQHVVVIEATAILGSYEEAFDRLRATYGDGQLPRSLNLISGPSRTADIEQTIVRGAHGPKRLLVVVLDS
jgi:L-lactate dehydrogenase complex protein LldG